MLVTFVLFSQQIGPPQPHGCVEVEAQGEGSVGGPRMQMKQVADGSLLPKRIILAHVGAHVWMTIRKHTHTAFAGSRIRGG